MGLILGALSEQWSANKWTLTSLPAPSNPEISIPDSVTRSAPHACVAVGSWLANLSLRPFADSWDGTSWFATKSTDRADRSIRRRLRHLHSMRGCWRRRQRTLERHHLERAAAGSAARRPVPKPRRRNLHQAGDLHRRREREHHRIDPARRAFVIAGTGGKTQPSPRPPVPWSCWCDRRHPDGARFTAVRRFVVLRVAPRWSPRGGSRFCGRSPRR